MLRKWNEMKFEIHIPSHSRPHSHITFSRVPHKHSSSSSAPIPNKCVYHFFLLTYIFRSHFICVPYSSPMKWNLLFVWLPSHPRDRKFFLYTFECVKQQKTLYITPIEFSKKPKKIYIQMLIGTLIKLKAESEKQRLTVGWTCNFG